MYDDYSNEATITIANNGYEIKCYCFDYSHKLKVILTCLLEKDIEISNDKFEYIIKGKGYYSYIINGVVKNIINGIVECKGFEIHTDELPDGIQIGDFIFMDITRINIE